MGNQKMSLEEVRATRQHARALILPGNANAAPLICVAEGRLLAVRVRLPVAPCAPSAAGSATCQLALFVCWYRLDGSCVRALVRSRQPW